MQSASSRAMLIPNVCRWLKPHLGTYDASKLSSPKDSQAAEDSNRVSWLESVRLSISVIASLLDRLHVYLVDPKIMGDRDALMQEQDSIEYVLSLLPRLLDSFQETDSKANKEALQRHKSPATKIAKFPAIFPATYPFSLLTVFPVVRASGLDSQVPPVQSVRGELAAVVIVMLHISSPSLLKNFFDSSLEIEGHHNFTRFVSHLFRIGRSFLNNEAYPASWLNISMLAHKAVIKVALATSTILIRQFVPDQRMTSTFDTQLWREFFDMLMTLLSSPSLIIEDFSPARQRAVWRLTGDLRGEGSKIWLRSWEALSWSDPVTQKTAVRYGGYQVKLTNLVDAILGICMSHHDELRSTAVTVLYSLIISEFQ